MALGSAFGRILPSSISQSGFKITSFSRFVQPVKAPFGILVTVSGTMISLIVLPFTLGQIEKIGCIVTTLSFPK